MSASSDDWAALRRALPWHQYAELTAGLTRCAIRAIEWLPDDGAVAKEVAVLAKRMDAESLAAWRKTRDDLMKSSAHTDMRLLHGKVARAGKGPQPPHRTHRSRDSPAVPRPARRHDLGG